MVRWYPPRWFMKSRNKFVALWFAVAAIPRLLGAFYLPNTFGDAYVYIRDIGALSTKIKAGTFAITDLYGFWLPLYQFTSALANVFVENGFYTGKIVSAVSGAGACLLVYAITLKVVQHQTAALLSFLLIALNPLHIMNSASAMTDVPHALFVLAALYFVLGAPTSCGRAAGILPAHKERWIVAAVFAALAGLTRVESWMLIALIPAIQFWKVRRVSIPAILIMLFAPLFWFWISWKATGDWLACFKAREQYNDWLLEQNPALAQFSVTGVIENLAMLVSGVDPAVFSAALIALWLVLRRFIKRPTKTHDVSGALSIVPVLVFFFPFLALLVIAYLTHKQPIIFPRYGLILFSLGIPILAWTYCAIVRQRPQWSRRLLIAIVVLCSVNTSAQFVGGVGELNRYRAQRRAADYLRVHFDPNSGARVFCDEGTVRALSGIPEDRFVTSAAAPKNPDEFLRFLSHQNVSTLVYVKQPGSTLATVFADAESREPDAFEFATASHSEFLPTHIRVFERRRR